ncbi:Atypical chemokine receptor 3 [Sciurus carolinensis]|uniref:Atypical chemokine receptor 3 n=1 Tax=Sciurus carolinensis TaxID=30640 RepID=A0AA41T8D0_SCICA|nr:Atypical chemokine receptor 3 [Sciurus carolinensis]
MLSFIYIFIFMIGMIANTVVVWVNIQVKITGYDSHCYILNLAIMDLIFFLTCMSVDRYLSITYFTSTSSHRKKMVCFILCVLVWLLAFCVSVSDTYYLKSITSVSNNETYCRSFYPEHSIKK